MSITAEYEHLTRYIVTVDIDKFVEGNREDRKNFSGSDSDYVRKCMREWHIKDVDYSEPELGIHSEGDYDETDISFIN